LPNRREWEFSKVLVSPKAFPTLSDPLANQAGDAARGALRAGGHFHASTIGILWHYVKFYLQKT
jgi:hypothetical protein